MLIKMDFVAFILYCFCERNSLANGFCFSAAFVNGFRAEILFGDGRRKREDVQNKILMNVGKRFQFLDSFFVLFFD